MKYYYTGMGLTIGTGIAGCIAIAAYALTGNLVYIAFTGVGTALGLILGARLDSKNKEQEKPDKQNNSEQQ